MSRRALLTGFFSTSGDMECLRIVGHWLEQAGIPYDIAPYSQRVHEAIHDSLDLQKLDPSVYSHLIVLCGPCSPDLLKEQKLDLSRFRRCTRIGVNLSMIRSVDDWNPFHALLGRDSDQGTRPDLAFLLDSPTTPVVGRCLIHKQREYGDRQRHETARKAIDGLIERRGLAVVDIDTRWCQESNPLKTPSSVISVMKRLDFVLTTRLHGLVFGLKAGIPVMALDPISGGAKVMAQAQSIGWPRAILAEEATHEAMDAAADWCLSNEAKAAVADCQLQIKAKIADTEIEFRSIMESDRIFTENGKSEGQKMGLGETLRSLLTGRKTG